MNRLVGRYVKTLRQQHNLSQDQLARKAKVSPNTLRKIEYGMTRPPRLATMERLAKAFGLTTAQLMQGPKGLAATDPLLAGLNVEDVDIARRYHDAPTRLRQQIQLLLTEGVDGRLMQVLEHVAGQTPEEIAVADALITLDAHVARETQPSGSLIADSGSRAPRTDVVRRRTPPRKKA